MTSINNNNTVDEVFPLALHKAINHYHRLPNEMDRLRWLGESLVNFFVTEWFSETKAEYLSSIFFLKINFVNKNF